MEFEFCRFCSLGSVTLFHTNMENYGLCDGHGELDCISGMENSRLYDGHGKLYTV